MLTVLGFLILPLIWSVPEALITAELATAFPENSGYVAWVTAAFGPFWGFQVCSNDMWLAGGLQAFATPWTGQLIVATLLFAGGMAELDFRRHRQQVRALERLWACRSVTSSCIICRMHMTCLSAYLPACLPVVPVCTRSCLQLTWKSSSLSWAQAGRACKRCALDKVVCVSSASWKSAVQ